jgi:predicted PolB exonuclease-like 3'-5' exonuclease
LHYANHEVKAEKSMSETATDKNTALTKEDFKKEVLNDYKTAYISRQASLLGEKKYSQGKPNLEYLVTARKWLK